GRESAAIYVARAGAGYGGGNDRWIDVRVDDHDDPIGELGRLLDLQRLYLDRPALEDLVRVEEVTAGQLRGLLGRLGAGRGSAFAAVARPMRALDPDAAAAERAARPMTGEPAPLPSNWDSAWQQALEDWMAVENLEERITAPGWVDRRVLDFLRARAGE